MPSPDLLNSDDWSVFSFEDVDDNISGLLWDNFTYDQWASFSYTDDDLFVYDYFPVLHWRTFTYNQWDTFSNEQWFTFDLDSTSTNLSNWAYEKEQNKFVPVPSTGVASSYIGRRIRFDTIDSNDYLTRASIIYIRIRQKTDTGQVGLYRTFQKIINT